MPSCKHGEFDINKGCPQCIAERVAEERTAEAINLEAGVGKAEVLTVMPEKLWATAISPRAGEDFDARKHYEQGLVMLKHARAMTVKTLDDSKTVTTELAIIGTLKRAMEAKRKEKLEPHQTIVRDIQETYKFLMEPVLEAERILKGLQVTFLQEQARIQREQEALNLKKMQLAQEEMRLNGEMSQPVDLVEVIEAPKLVRTEMGTSGLVDHWTYEITDFALLSDAYKVADTAQLTAIARGHHDKKQVPGVRFFNQPFLSTRR